MRFNFVPNPPGMYYGNDQLPEPGDDKVRDSTAPRRAGAYLFDGVIPFLFLFFGSRFLADATWVFVLWNSIWLQGKSGASLGKRMFGLRLAFIPEPMNEKQVHFLIPGVGRCAARFVLHIFLDTIGMIGFIKALWSPHGQSFADHPCSTAVIADDRVTLLTKEEYLREIGRR